MRAYRLLAPGRAEIVEIHTPRPGPGEVLLKVTASGVCHSDVFIRDALPALRMTFPVTLGHEVVGVIAELGEGAKGWDVGQQVASYVMRGCGECVCCKAGKDNFCHVGYKCLGTHFDGGMAEYMVIPVDAIADADGLDPVAAAPLTDAGLTALHTVNSVRLDQGAPRRTLVIGVGGLGHLAVQIAADRFGTEIIAVDKDPKRLKLARELGAAHAVVADDSAVDKILELASGREVDVVLDFVGTDETLLTAAAVTNRGAQIVVAGLGLGSIPFEAKSVSTVAPEISLLRAAAGSRRELSEALALGRAGVIRAASITYPLEQAGTAIDDVASGTVIGRAVVVP
jgi:propanol-preferring alcohol dehydrogenase